MLINRSFTSKWLDSLPFLLFVAMVNYPSAAPVLPSRGRLQVFIPNSLSSLRFTSRHQDISCVGRNLVDAHANPKARHEVLVQSTLAL